VTRRQPTATPDADPRPPVGKLATDLADLPIARVTSAQQRRAARMVAAAARDADECVLFLDMLGLAP
jgi:hypothetical protein